LGNTIDFSVITYYGFPYVYSFIGKIFRRNNGNDKNKSEIDETLNSLDEEQCNLLSAFIKHIQTKNDLITNGNDKENNTQM
jgi:hypothetical protein